MKTQLTIILTLLSLIGFNQEQTRILGTNIFLNIPEGFALDSNSLNTYYNYKGEYITARVVDNDYETIKAVASWDFYKAYGNNKFVREDSIEISGIQGIFFECIMEDINHSYQITVGDSNRTYQIIAGCYQNSSLLKEEFDELFKNIKIDTSYDIPWNDKLGFEVKGSKDYVMKEPNFNTVAIFPNENLEIDLIRVVNLPNRIDPSERILLSKGKMGWEERKDLIINDTLQAEDTIINNQHAFVLKTYCKEVSKKTLLVEAVIEGKTQRVFVFCKIQDDFDNRQKQLLSFLDRIKVN